MIWSRRRLLQGMAAAPMIGAIAGTAQAGAARPLFRIVADRRLASGRALAGLAARHALPLVDPEGELIHLFRGRCAAWLEEDVPLVGITGYADFILMADLARERGRRLAGDAPGRDPVLPGAPERLLAAVRAKEGDGFVWRVRPAGRRIASA